MIEDGDNPFAALVPSATTAAAVGPSAPDNPFAALVPKRPTTSGADAFGRGVKSGATLGFDDELTGVANAATAGLPEPVQRIGEVMSTNPVMGPIVAAAGAVRTLGESIFGGADAAKAYQAGRDAVRQKKKEAQADRPGTYLAGELTGGLVSAVAAPQAVVARGAGLGARTVNNVVNGAMQGAAHGAGDGEGIADTAAKTVVGGIGGGVAGGVLTPLADLAGRGAAAITRPIRDAISPDRAAARQATAAFAHDAPGDPNPMDTAARVLEISNANNLPLIAADTGGATVRALTDSASLQSTRSRDALKGITDARFEDQNGRLTTVVNAALGRRPSAYESREAIDAAARVANRPAYTTSYAAGDREIWSPELERLTSAPSVLQAMRAAVNKWKDWQVHDGFGGANPPAMVSRGGILEFTGSSGVPTYPNIQFWDYTARNIADRAAKARQTGATQEAARLGGLERQLKAELDRMVPEFQTARRGAARFFDAEDALTAGERFATGEASLGRDEARAAVAAMSEPERRLFAEGFASKLSQQIAGVAERSNITNKAFLNSTRSKEAIELALGPDGARRIEATLRLENMMNETKAAVSGSSKTAQRLFDAGLGTAGVGYDVGQGDLGLGTAAIVAAMTKTGARTINRRVADRVGELLASRDPDALRQAAEMAVRNPRLMDAIRQADNLITRTVSQQTPKLITVNVAGRAEEQK